MLRWFGERPGAERDEAWWAAVYALYEEAFPGLPAGIARAAAAGARWEAVTTPFALFEGPRAVAHVGVLCHPMRLGGQTVEVAGVHAVCTAGDHRRQGLARRLLGDALVWADGRYSLAKLHTDLPDVYSGHGFTVRPTFRWRSDVEPAAGVDARCLTPSTSAADAALLRDHLARRAPASEVCAGIDAGWMPTIVAALRRSIDTCFHWLPEHDTIVAWEPSPAGRLILDVIAETPPEGSVVLGALEGEGPTWWTFSPDRFEPAATAVAAPAAIGHLMIRGDGPAELAWPTRIGVSPLWEH